MKQPNTQKYHNFDIVDRIWWRWDERCDISQFQCILTSNAMALTVSIIKQHSTKCILPFSTTILNIECRDILYTRVFLLSWTLFLRLVIDFFHSQVFSRSSNLINKFFFPLKQGKASMKKKKIYGPGGQCEEANIWPGRSVLQWVFVLCRCWESRCKGIRSLSFNCNPFLLCFFLEENSNPTASACYRSHIRLLYTITCYMYTINFRPWTEEKWEQNSAEHREVTNLTPRIGHGSVAVGQKAKATSRVKIPVYVSVLVYFRF